MIKPNGLCTAVVHCFPLINRLFISLINSFINSTVAKEIFSDKTKCLCSTLSGYRKQFLILYILIIKIPNEYKTKYKQQIYIQIKTEYIKLAVVHSHIGAFIEVI